MTPNMLSQAGNGAVPSCTHSIVPPLLMANNINEVASRQMTMSESCIIAALLNKAVKATLV
jgi:hypothetical protein